ncbi:MAG: DNA polymerase III, epsilon subunit [Desulfotomaculum sp. 46_296]|nr:MAG: DNA polymerase III, epsilon subunit [Desulfotomaculum sp. 46_296]HAU32387.1 DNA polymerase III subunit epsilon [Desulfotomaculum sp.]
MLISFVVCDLETTGLSPRQDEIIEIGMALVENGEIAASYHSLVRPSRKLPVSIRRLTGLDDQMLASCPELPEVLPRALEFLGGHPLVGHNVSFDKGFLEEAAGPLKNPSYDTLELARVVFPFSPGFSLGALCRFLNIKNEKEHRALSDTLATVELYGKLVDALKELDARVILQVIAFLAQAGSSWVKPLSGALKNLTGGCAQRKIGEKVVCTNPEFGQTEQYIMTTAPKEAVLLPEQEELPSLFEAKGPLASNLADYEYRPQQEQMVRAVCGALSGQKYLLMEAGTGTGKSIAYLIPALHWAITRGERVVVSTRTINLQEQLWLKDIPGLLGALSWPCKAALVKGRSNYLCLRRWFSVQAAANCRPDEAAFYARVQVWAAATATGDRSELFISSFEMDYWSNICSDSENCLGMRCRWFKGQCYVAKAHRAAEAANLIITNHSQLFSDIRMENKVLPAYGPLVIDEAHHLEDIATEQLGRQVSWAAVRRWTGAVSRFLSQLDVLVPSGDFEIWRQTRQEARNTLALLVHEAQFFFEAARVLVISRSSSDYQGSDRWTLRIKRTGLENRVVFLEAEYSNLEYRFGELLDCLHKLYGILETWLQGGASEYWSGLSAEIDQHLSCGRGLAADLAFVMFCRENNFVYWAEAAEEAYGCSLHAVPIQVGEILNEQLFKTKETVVLTSATLSAGGSFEHFKERTGLDLLPAERLIELKVDSPFSYSDQSLLCIARDMPSPYGVPGGDYFEALLESLTGLIKAVQGKTLILFTSHQALREVHRRLKDFCEEENLYLLAHNIDGGRSRLVEAFRKSERAVLLGASSFWEGIDIPGEALSCVVIVKLPFWAPGIPVIEARLEELAGRGKDGFLRYSLPQAVIKFKQGFGRLIRTMRDRGVVVVLDPRLLNKRYGRHFLISLPVKTHFRGDTWMIKDKVAQWLKYPAAHPGTQGPKDVTFGA